MAKASDQSPEASISPQGMAHEGGAHEAGAREAGNREASSREASPREASAHEAMAATMARARWLMLISALTTAIAIAAVIGVIGYRVFAAGGSSTATITDSTVFLPKGAHVVSAAVSEGRIAMTLDIGGANEVRIYDLKTLKQIGRLRFATEP
jgi:hypothetical protein